MEILMNLLKTVAFTLFATVVASSAYAQTNNGFYVQGNVGAGVPNASSDLRDPSTVLGVAVGYKSGVLRVEGEYLKLGVSSNATNKFTTLGNRVNLGSTDANLLDVNLVVEPVTYRGFTPFVKGGVGYGVFGGSGTTGNGVVFNAGGGLAYSVNTHLDLVTEYRYFLSENKNTRQNDGSFDNFKQHVVTAGLRYNF
jgi:opacity protein-like surface antigen